LVITPTSWRGGVFSTVVAPVTTENCLKRYKPLPM
jgi:hypothetical protein